MTKCRNENYETSTNSDGSVSCDEIMELAENPSSEDILNGDVPALFIPQIAKTENYYQICPLYYLSNTNSKSTKQKIKLNS